MRVSCFRVHSILFHSDAINYNPIGCVAGHAKNAAITSGACSSSRAQLIDLNKVHVTDGLSMLSIIRHLLMVNNPKITIIIN